MAEANHHSQLGARALVGTLVAETIVDLRCLLNDRIALRVHRSGSADVVALGKSAALLWNGYCAARGMPERGLVVGKSGDEGAGWLAPQVVYGSHPLPGHGSISAGKVLKRHLSESMADETIFLLSGGVSSILASPIPPVGLADLREISRIGLASGADVTSLNLVRSSVSELHEGRVLNYTRTRAAHAFVVVDNVQAGVAGVGSSFLSACSAESWTGVDAVESVCREIGLSREVVGRVLEAAAQRADGLGLTRFDHVEPLVSPADGHRILWDQLALLGVPIVDLGVDVQGDVEEVAATWIRAIRELEARGVDRYCLVGAGEVTVRVGRAQSSVGYGGRCQELAIRMLPVLNDASDAAFAAIATDGQDYIRGVGGALVDQHTSHQVSVSGFAADDVLAAHDSGRALAAAGALLPSGVGPNVCDLYVYVRLS